MSWMNSPCIKRDEKGWEKTLIWVPTMCQEASVKIVMLSVIFEWHSKDLLYGQNNEDSLLLFPYIYIPCTVHVCAKSFQPCPTLCNPRDYSPPGSSVHGLLQASILEWVAMPSSRGSSRPRDQIHVSCVSSIGRWVLTTNSTCEASTGLALFHLLCVLDLQSNYMFTVL